MKEKSRSSLVINARLSWLPLRSVSRSGLVLFSASTDSIPETELGFHRQCKLAFVLSILLYGLRISRILPQGTC